MDSRLTRIITYVITGIWVISLLLAMIDRTYSVPMSIQAAMGAVVGYLFGNQLLKSDKGPPKA